MRPLAALILCGVSLFAPIGFAQDAPAPIRIAGTVVNAVTGEPIPGATVVARPVGEDFVDSFGFTRRTGDLVRPSRTLTDDFGKFAFEADAALVSLQLTVSHPGFHAEDNLNAASLTVRPSGAGEIRVRLAPVSVIQGLVLNSTGEPLPGITVQAIRMEIREGRQLRTPFADKDTNERGEYRFDGLPAGAYFLRATSPPAAPSAKTNSAFGPIYYPSATNPDSAQSLRVAPGRAVTADFTLESHATYRIRGIVSNPPPRRPLAMRLLRGDDVLGNTATFSPNGTFEMTNVVPGSYLLQVYTPNSTPPDFGEAIVTIDDHDLPSVKIALTTGVDVSGHVEFRGPTGSEHYAQIHALAVNARRWPVNIAEPSVVINERGNFVLKNLLPGQYDIAVRGLPDYYLAEIHAGGSDVLADGLTVEPNSAPHLNVVMQAGGGQIEGIIEGTGEGTGEGASPGAYAVALIAKLGTVQVPTIVRAADGRFHAAGLTPGDYTLYAWPETRAVEYRNPWALSDLAAYATQVTVHDGGKHVVAVKPIP